MLLGKRTTLKNFLKVISRISFFFPVYFLISGGPGGRARINAGEESPGSGGHGAG